VSELKLSASEALYGFVGWLTTRKEPTVLSSATVIDRAPALIEAFCRENDLDAPRDRWPVLLKHPVEEPKASTNAMNEAMKEVDRAIDGERCAQSETQAADPLGELKHRLLQAAIFYAGHRSDQAIAFVNALVSLKDGV